MLGRLERLPAPQRAVLRSAFGLGPESVQDRFLGRAGYLELAGRRRRGAAPGPPGRRPAGARSRSAQVLGFVARRLAAESIVPFAARVPGDELAGCRSWWSRAWRGRGRALLDVVVTGPLTLGSETDRRRDARATRWRCWSCREWGRRSWRAGSRSPTRCRCRGGSRRAWRRLDALPADTRELLLVAAAEPVGDPVLVWRAAGRLGIRASCDAGSRCRPVRGRHPRAVPASPGAFGGLPVGVAAGAPGHPPRPGAGHRSDDRSRPPGLAPRAGRARA